MWENGGKFYSGGILNKRLNFQSDLFKKEGSDFSEEKKKKEEGKGGKETTRSCWDAVII